MHTNKNNSFNLNLIKQLIESRFMLLLSHVKYIADYEKKLISQEAMEDYCYDLLSLKYLEKDFNRDLCIIKDSIDEAVKKTKNLLIALKNFEEPKNLLFLKALVQYDLTLYPKKKVTGINPFYNVNHHLHDFDLLNQFQNSLDELIDPKYNAYFNVVKLAFVASSVPDFVLDNKKINQLKLQYSVNWNYIVSEYNILMKKISPCEMNPFQRNEKTHEAYKAVNKIIESIKQRGTKPLTISPGNGAELYKFHEENIDFFLKTYPVIEIVVSDMRKRIDNKEAIVAELKKQSKVIQRKFKDLTREHTELSNLIKSSKQIPTADQRILQEHDTFVKELKKEIEICIKQFETIQRESNLDHFNQSIELLSQAILKISYSLQDIRSRLQLEIMTWEDLQKQITIAKHAIIEQQAESQKIRDAYLAYRKELDQKYKAEIDKKRQLKDNEKLTSTKEEKDSIESEKAETKTFVNSSIEDLLQNLNRDQLDLLESIHLEKKGATYSDICNLITNHLNGQILEIGNGSSHKRIVLEKYIVEIMVQDQEQGKEELEEKLDNVSVATGGFWRQHKKGHSIRKLSEFNLSLVGATLNKAGITLSVVQQLRENLSVNASSINL